MKRNPERTAWLILSISFFICIGLAILTPLGIRQYVFNSHIEQEVTLNVQRGSLSVTLGGLGEPKYTAEDRSDISAQTVVATNDTAGRLVMRPAQKDGILLTTVQLYDDTEVVFSSAHSPRFSISHLPHETVLEVKRGRVRINVFDSENRSTIAEVYTPYGSTTLTEGSYEVKVNGDAMEVIVRAGKADVENNVGQSMLLRQSRRAVVDGEQILPLPTARNLVDNGDFQESLENGWVRYSEQSDPQQPPGKVDIVINEGQKVANFYRDGQNHAEVGLRQEIDYDVRDFTFLELRLVALRVIQQDITGFGGCGYLSSECPIIVAINYKDINNTDRQWRHGFYTGEPAPDWPLHPWTEKISRGNWHTYESGNLMEELSKTPPAFIKALTIYASGHSFHAMATEVELLARE